MKNPYPKHTPIEVTEFNTNNAWGFGGSFGKKFQYKKHLKLVKGTACYRHAGTSDWTEYYYKDQLIEKKEFEEYLNSMK